MNEQLKLNDIKGLVEIPDYSFVLFCIVIGICFIIIVALIYFIINFFRRRKHNIRKSWYKTLNELDLNDTKKAAYTITKYGILLAQNEREKKIINQIITQLEEHKYKKDVSPLTKQIKSEFQIFMESVDV